MIFFYIYITIMFAPILKLHNWIYRNKFIYDNLEYDENSIELMKKENDMRINWAYIALNPNSIQKLKDNADKINWSYLSTNPSGIQVVKEENKTNKINTQENNQDH
jgi:hypothetical protein